MKEEKEIYRKIISDDEPWNNQYILEGEGKDAYDRKRKVFLPALLAREVFDVVYLKKRNGERRFVEFKSVFEKEYKKL